MYWMTLLTLPRCIPHICKVWNFMEIEDISVWKSFQKGFQDAIWFWAKGWYYISVFFPSQIQHFSTLMFKHLLSQFVKHFTLGKQRHANVQNRIFSRENSTLSKDRNVQKYTFFQICFRWRERGNALVIHSTFVGTRIKTNCVWNKNYWLSNTMKSIYIYVGPTTPCLHNIIIIMLEQW